MKKKITARWLRDEYFAFFKEKEHRVIPNSPLIPQDDSSALFTSAGMHPLVPYLLGEPHPLGRRLVGIQKCLRTGDIEKVGDGFHHTFFEMLGNWSLGDYWKKETVSWSWQFLTKNLGFSAEKISVTCFAGDKEVKKDKETAGYWEKVGIPQERIFFLGREDNWWGPVGKTGPCGPDTEMFVDTGAPSCSSSCQPGCSCGKYIEVWNNVFMEYLRDEKGHYLPLKQKNVDTGMGVERVVALLLGKKDDDYQTPIFSPLIEKIAEISGKSYQGEWRRPMRIIADHLRAAVFIVNEGIVPGNKEHGYVLRRLIRRSIREGKQLGMDSFWVKAVAEEVIANIDNYGDDYQELRKEKTRIVAVLEEEERKFRRTLDRGLKELEKLFSSLEKSQEKKVSGKDAFYLYETFGFPLELVKEEAQKRGFVVDEKDFLREKEKHQRVSQTAAKGRFKSGLATRSPQIIKYHTATHLLQAALRKILGKHVQQAGSNITEERLRFDFTHPSPLTPEQIKAVEDLVNQKIAANLPVKMEVMSFEESQKRGALAFFKGRYPPQVKVYFIGDFSCEVCAGPHVKATGQLGKFRIIKEESCGSGKRRIYAVLEK